MNHLKDYFRPEFLNRLDEIVIFNPLSMDDISHIVDMQLEELVVKRMIAKGFKVDIDAAIKKYIAKEGYDPVFGARPIKRVIQRQILDKLADKIIKREINGNKKVRISLKEPDRISVN